MQENDRIRQWLNQTSTTCTIVYAGLTMPSWDKGRQHDQYYVTLTNTKGSWCYPFWDSVIGTQLHHQTKEEHCIQHYKCHYYDLLYNQRKIVDKTLADIKRRHRITAYDVLSCLTISYPGTFDEFCGDFGLSNDSISALHTYQGCCEEYAQLHRLFTNQDLKQLRSIINGD